MLLYRLDANKQIEIGSHQTSIHQYSVPAILNVEFVLFSSDQVLADSCAATREETITIVTVVTANSYSYHIKTYF
jgi:hypothetical protein